MIRSGMDRLRHLRKVLEQIPVLPTPHTHAEDIRVLQTLEEFRRQQDVVDFLRLRSIPEGARTAVAFNLGCSKMSRRLEPFASRGLSGVGSGVSLKSPTIAMCFSPCFRRSS
jgi:hypothetical protein